VAILAGLGIAGMIAGSSRVAALVRHAQAGADPATALKTVPGLPSDTARIVWAIDPPGHGRMMEPATRRALTSAYGRAWGLLDGAASGAGKAGLDTVLSGPALGFARAAADARRPAGTLRRSLTHRLTLRFYSADGSIVSLEDTADILRGSLRGDRSLEEVSERYDVLLVLHDGAWHLRSLVRRSVGPRLR